MGMVVRSNIMAMNANRQLGVNNSSVSKNLEKLSSGFKINRAGDDASGLAISEKMKAQIKGLETASANSQDGISLVQTAEGALTEVHDMLNRMVELATKSANGTIQDEVDREAIQSEVDALNDEIDRISQSTNFNGINLLDGTMGSSKSGASAKSGISVGSIIAADTTILPTDNPAVGEIKTLDNVTAANGTLDGAGNQLKVEAGETLTFTYKDAKGIATEVKITLDEIAAGESAANINQAIIDKLEEAGFGKQFKVEDDAGKLKFTALGDYSLAGFTASAGLTTAGNGLFDGVALDTANVTAPTPAYTMLDTNGTANLAKGDVITVNGKTYEFVAADGDAVKTKGATAITLGATLADTVTALNKELKKSGINVTLADPTDPFNAAGANKTALVFTKSTSTTAVSGDGLTLQIGDTGDDFNMVTVKVDDMSAKGLGTNGLDVSNADAARGSIQTIRDAINKVSTNRADLGALQNRLEHTINNLDVAAENMSAANSRIRDTDMAKQMMEYTKMNVLTQAAQAMLAQANQQPQSILQLLQ